MADIPRLQQPYANTTVPQQYLATQDTDDSSVPKGRNVGKVSQAQLALEGLIGSR